MSGADPVLTGGVGARVLRKEDDRLLRGRGEFVGDIRLPQMLEVAFLRSPVAHARIRKIEKPADAAGSVFTAADLKGAKPIRADSRVPGFRSSDQPPLATDKTRHVGDPIAACVAPTRALAEDLAEAVLVDLEELPAVVEMTTARDPGQPLVHEHWDENCFLESAGGGKADIAALKAAAAHQIRLRVRTARQSMAPLEGRGTVVWWDERAGQLVVYSGQQMVHVVRSGLAECLGLEEGQVRIISPDVGGGFGYKGILLQEDVALGFMAMTLKRPLRWIEDRREQLTAQTNCREHFYDIAAWGSADGDLLAVECDAIVDAGAYSAYPFSACLEGAQVVSILPGPYDFPGYHCRAASVCTNKPPILPYRGVARTGVCFAMELAIDALAHETGMEPAEYRLRNLVRPDQMPFDNVVGKHFDSGDYGEAVRRAMAAIDLPAFRARQAAENTDQRRIGVGFAIYCEQAAHGTSVYHGWGIPFVPGYEQAHVRFTPDGGLEVRVGAHSHGQGMETSMAQVASEILGLDIAAIRIVHGDTAMTPYSTGTWGSRCGVMVAGAVAAACETLAARACAIGAHLLQAPADTVRIAEGAVHAGAANVSLATVAKTWYRRPQDLPADVDPGGLEATQGYKLTPKDHGTFSYACHACIVAVDTEIGAVALLDYQIVEDGGVLINPLIVDGQIMGGLAQGVGTALYEEMGYDEAGQPLASTLADYHLPGATETPDAQIAHMETPSPYSRFGQKGLGEGGAIAPPAAIANAVNDALGDWGVRITESPITPERLLAAIARARSKEAAA